MLSQALDTHSELGKEKDTEWIHVLLSFLKTYIETQGSELLIHEEDKVEYISQLVQAMKIVAAELQTGQSTYPIFSRCSLAHLQTCHMLTIPRFPSRSLRTLE